MLDHVDLFSGIGGFALGLERTGGIKTRVFCEQDSYCQRVLKKHWPDVPIIDDVRNFNYDGSAHIITAGFPCQPHSVAGRRLGAKDDRDFWPQTLSVIERFKPAFFIGENVFGLRSMVFECLQSSLVSRELARYEAHDFFNAIYAREEKMYLAKICEDLGNTGYAVAVFAIPACAVDAPHIRQRVWILAYSAGTGLENRKPAGIGSHEKKEKTQLQPKSKRCGFDVAHAEGFGMERNGAAWKRESQTQIKQEISGFDGSGIRAENWPIEPRLGRMAHGVPDRVDRLKGLGNAVVPQIPEIFGRAILQHIDV